MKIAIVMYGGVIRAVWADGEGVEVDVIDCDEWKEVGLSSSECATVVDMRTKDIGMEPVW